MPHLIRALSVGLLLLLPVPALAQSSDEKQPASGPVTPDNKTGETDNSGTSPAIYGGGNATSGEATDQTTSGKKESDSGTVQDDTYGGDPSTFSWILPGLLGLALWMGRKPSREVKQQALAAATVRR